MTVSANELKKRMASDLSRYYNIIYNNAKDIEEDNVLGFLAYNTLHMHSHAVEALKKLINDEAHAKNACSLAESPLYSLLVPIAAHEYSIDLLSLNRFSSLFHSVIDNMLGFSNSNRVECCNYIPCNYMISSLHRIQAGRYKVQGIRQGEGLDRLLQFTQTTYPDHFENSKSYLMGLIEAHGLHQSSCTIQTPVDSTFFRTFGHTIFQPDWLVREFRVASLYFKDKLIIPAFLRPRVGSLLGLVNHRQSNCYILNAWVEVFNESPSVGRFTTLDELAESYVEQGGFVAFFPYEYSFSEIVSGDKISTYNKTGSAVYEKTKGIIKLSLGQAIKRLEPRLTAPRISNRKIAILHVRSSAFYGDINHRNSDIKNYQLLSEHLYYQGYDVYNYSNPEMREMRLQSIFNYYDYKTKRLDALIACVADLIVSTPSGIGCTGRLFGVNELVTNFWPYVFDGVPSDLKIIPKIVIDRKSRRVLGFQEVISLSADLQPSNLEEHPGYIICENSEQDLLLGIQDFLNGRMISLCAFLPNTLASAPESFVKKYFC